MSHEALDPQRDVQNRLGVKWSGVFGEHPRAVRADDGEQGGGREALA